MAQKPDYYEVLGVDKKASVDEIKKAFKGIAMKCHPDMLRNKTDAEKKAAGEKFQLANEALEVLTDASKRSTYDSYGHKGLENLKSGGSASTGQSYTDAAGPVHRQTRTAEDTFNFFDRKRDERETGTVSPDRKPAQTGDQRDDRMAEERRLRREAARQKTTSAPPSAPQVFNDVAEKMSDASSRLKEVALPVEALEKFRDNLQDFLGEIDAAISRARKQGGPGCK